MFQLRGAVICFSELGIPGVMLRLVVIEVASHSPMVGI
jgi:hypothetical protein